jgi:hypothetical protein
MFSVAALAAAAVVRASDDEANSKTRMFTAKIADLAWIQGHWTTNIGADELHEIWSPPQADCMMASFCWIKDGSVWMYELLTIAEEGKGLVLRFKHFSRELHGWEEKDKAITLELVELTDKLAAFKNTREDGPTWMVFRKESPTQLTVRVGGEKEGGESDLEIRYELSK